MAQKKENEGGKGIWVFFLIILFLNIFNDILPEGLGIGIVIVFVIIFNFVNKNMKRQGTSIQKVGVKQFIHILQTVAKNISSSRKSISSYGPVSANIGEGKNISLTKETVGGSSEKKGHVYNTTSLGGKDILGRTVNPMSLDGK